MLEFFRHHRRLIATMLFGLLVVSGIGHTWMSHATMGGTVLGDDHAGAHEGHRAPSADGSSTCLTATVDRALLDCVKRCCAPSPEANLAERVSARASIDWHQAAVPYSATPAIAAIATTKTHSAPPDRHAWGHPDSAPRCARPFDPYRVLLI